MNNNISIKSTALFLAVLAIFFISKSVFARVPAYIETIVCPQGYICLKKDDPLIMASTSQCFKSAQVNIDTSKTKNQENKIDNKNELYKDSVTAYLKSINEDHAGIWNVFKPGVGSLEGKKEDYGFVVEITLSKPKTIKSITITNNGGNEGWSTSKDQSIFGKYPYPLVVLDKDGRQLNDVYDKSFSIKEGKTAFVAYGQIEVPGLDRPEIIVEFLDGVKITSPVSEKGPASDAPGLTNRSSDCVARTDCISQIEQRDPIWDKILHIFGF